MSTSANSLTLLSRSPGTERAPARRVESLCEMLSWDTEFFHRRIGRVHADTLDEPHALAIDDWSRKHNIECLYFLANADCLTTPRTATNHEFALMDIRMTFECRLPVAGEPPQPKSVPEMLVRPVEPEDVPALQAIARVSHTDTRFFSDPHFPQSLAEELYSTWIGLECQARASMVFVAIASKGPPCGYISCHLEVARGAGQIVLVAVSQEFRGRGLGRRLVWTAQDWLARQGARQITVVTQGKNLAAQKLYAQCGFAIREIRLWYHKWYSPAA
jgi:dTDP-4-amino-4,6-dideoxy-D-galactose acyltransferase